MAGHEFDRDAVFKELSGAADGYGPEDRRAFALALIVALCERVGDRQRVSEAIADAKRAVKPGD